VDFRCWKDHHDEGTWVAAFQARAELHNTHVEGLLDPFDQHEALVQVALECAEDICGTLVGPTGHPALLFGGHTQAQADHLGQACALMEGWLEKGSVPTEVE
jgi:hypothetical protein